MPTVVETETRSLPQQSVARPPTAPLWLTWALAGVLVAATLAGLLGEGMYRETFARDHLGATLRGQDALTLLTVPVLLWTAHRARAGSLRAHLVWLGVLLYVPYTYLMYVVVPYNDAFLLYVAAIGLGAWLLLDGLVRLDVGSLAPAVASIPRRGVGIFLVVTGSVFALLWVVQNLGAPGGVPEGLFVYDVPSTVHVLDLGFVLPLVVASGVLLLRGHAAGPVLAAVLLVKMVTLGLALLAMNLGVLAAGGTMNAAETAMWLTIVVVSGGLLVRGSRQLGPVPDRWLRPTFW